MNPPSERPFPRLPSPKASARAKPEAARDDLIDASVMECYFLKHAAEREPLIH
jgi:hypothetical protein